MLLHGSSRKWGSMASTRLGRWHVKKSGVRPGRDGEPDFHYMRTYWLEVHWVDGEEVTKSGIDEEPGIQFTTVHGPLVRCSPADESGRILPGNLEGEET